MFLLLNFKIIIQFIITGRHLAIISKYVVDILDIDLWNEHLTTRNHLFHFFSQFDCETLRLKVIISLVDLPLVFELIDASHISYSFYLLIFLFKVRVFDDSHLREPFSSESIVRRHLLLSCRLLNQRRAPQFLIRASS